MLKQATDTAALRRAFGRYSTGVCIVTCVDAQGQRVGLTANSFATVSLEPALVLWSLRLASTSAGAFTGALRFAVNVLADAQLDLSRTFASREADKFAHGAWATGEGGAPILSGCAAVFECERVSTQVAGDHHLFIGRVLSFSDAPLAPLVFQAGHYHLLGEVL
jgi:4-hydroxyphenylacetate 3-hydroxylase, reductase component